MYYSILLPSAHKDQLSETECSFTTKIVLNGIIFSIDSWLPNFEDENNKRINQIIDIVILEMNDISKMFFVCKTYSVALDDHYRSFYIRMESLQNNVSLINVSDFLSRHYYPVKIQKIQNNYFFRCKRF